MARPLSEQGVIRLLTEALAGRGGSRGVRLGIGDDSAVLGPVRERLVWSVDTCVDKVHFERAWLSLSDVGARSLHAAVSDLAAMGATPLGALSSLILPSGTRPREVAALGRGQARAADELGCPIVGGNVSAGEALSVTTTVLGSAERPLTRSGARAGDEIWLLGDVGLAAAGLRWLADRGPARLPAEVRQCVQAWRQPRALVVLGRSLEARAHAVIDLSDGLAADAGHLAESSRVRVVLESDEIGRLLRPELVKTCQRLGRDPLAIALSGGEDYALLAAGPGARRPRAARRIGRVERGSGAFVESANGRRRALEPGFEHLR